MPLYSYRCPHGHLFDALRPMAFRASARCPECGETAELRPAVCNFSFGWRLDARSLNDDSDYSKDTIERNL